MRLPRTLAGEALLALVFALFFATPAPAGSIIVTETHTHSFRPGDSSASALAYARWGAVERVLASGVRKLREAGALKAKATGHEEAMLGAVVVVEVEALECGKGSCTASATVVFDPLMAAGNIRRILEKPEVSVQFERAHRERVAALREADALSARIAAGEGALPDKYERAVLDGFAWNLYFAGSALLMRDRQFEALESFTEFIRRRPGFSRAYLSRGAAYSSLGQHKRALADYDMAVDLSPEDAQSYNNRGVAYYNQGDHRRAVLDYTRAIQRDPALANAYNNRGNAYLDAADVKNALADYNRAIELDPGYAEAYNSRGTAYNTLGKTLLALADFTKATQVKPDYPDAFNNLAVTLHRQEKLSEAIENYSKALRLNSTYAEAYSNRGVAYQQQGNLRQAHSDYSNAIFHAPGYVGAYLNRARLNYNLKRTKEACADAETACKLGDCRVQRQLVGAGACTDSR